MDYHEHEFWNFVFASLIQWTSVQLFFFSWINPLNTSLNFLARALVIRPTDTWTGSSLSFLCVASSKVNHHLISHIKKSSTMTMCKIMLDKKELHRGNIGSFWVHELTFIANYMHQRNYHGGQRNGYPWGSPPYHPNNRNHLNFSWGNPNNALKPPGYDAPSQYQPPPQASNSSSEMSVSNMVKQLMLSHENLLAWLDPKS